jgi:hypothetical protein
VCLHYLLNLLPAAVQTIGGGVAEPVSRLHQHVLGEFDYAHRCLTPPSRAAATA